MFFGLIKIVTSNHISKLLKMQLEMFTPRGPVAGSFQHTLWPRGRASEAAILVSRAFAFLFSWYKVIIAISLWFSSGALQHTVHISIIATKIVSLGYFSSSNISVRTWGSLEQKQQYQSSQYKMQTAERALNADWEFILFFRLIRDNMSSYTYRASRNRFSAKIFHDWLHYCGKFFARLLITIVLNIISYSLLTLRASYLVWCL